MKIDFNTFMDTKLIGKEITYDEIKKKYPQVPYVYIIAGDGTPKGLFMINRTVFGLAACRLSDNVQITLFDPIDSGMKMYKWRGTLKDKYIEVH